MSPHPWQFDWKRPVWECSTTDSDAPRGHVTDHAAASVLPQELLGFIESSTSPEKDNNEDCYVLTVSLVQSSRRRDDDPVADVLWLEVLRQRSTLTTRSTSIAEDSSLSFEQQVQQPLPPTERMQSRILQWPGSALMNQDDDDDKDHSSSLFGKWTTRPKSTGIRSICLCRLPPTDPTAAQANALDVLHLLALGQTQGLSGTQQEWLHDNLLAVPEKPGSASPQQQPEHTDLVLVCLTATGKVHIYSPWALLLKKPVERGVAIDDEVEDSMASLLLGDQLLATIQTSMLPLCRPLQTLRLSIPFLKTNKERKEEQATTMIISEQKAISVWDSAVWDSMLDKSSLPFQTQQNVPTECVAVGEYLCIAGRGRRLRLNRQRHRRRYSDSSWSSHQSVTSTASEQAPPQADNGGFVTFVALANYSQVRTVYIPFVPCRISPMSWGGMTFCLVLGASRALLIRADHSAAATVVRGKPPSIFVDANNKNDQDKEIHIRPFQLLPIRLSTDAAAAEVQMVGSTVSTNPPAIGFLSSSSPDGILRVLQQTLQSVNLVSNYDDETWLPAGGDELAVVSTAHSMAHVARIATAASSPRRPWCHLGQGWCLVGTANKVHFILWEGATSTRGAFVHELPSCRGSGGGVASTVVPIYPFVHSVLPPAAPAEEWTDEDNVVFQVLQDISSSSFKEEVIGVSPRKSPHRRSKSFSRPEKFARLLRHCASWQQLEEPPQRLDQQVPVTTVRTDSGELCALSLRRSAGAAPFAAILAWLASRHDYFTASSLALDLLKDTQSLRHLWRAHDKMDDENEMAMLESLLDGILPVHDTNNEISSSTLTQLADMTIGCLIKGGIQMSSTLNQFVRRNRDYDPSRACIMLAAITPSTISARCDDDLEETLWPVRSLLQVGMAREKLSTPILLLNATIPDELRCRRRTDVAAAPPPSLRLCKALATLIVASSKEATELLLALVDEQSRKPFWESLDQRTCRELTLLRVNDRYPIVRQLEVRTWVTLELQKCIESEGSANINVFDMCPNAWLKGLCDACLSNAGCTLENDGSSSVKEGEADFDILTKFKDNIRILRQSLLPASGSGGLDFDLLIPALLILELREESWNSSCFSTRDVLNSACYMAGRRNTETPLFSMDDATLMRECVLAGNVQAGANLIGGKKGLVLECAHILMEEVDMTMEKAENFLLSETILPARNDETFPSAAESFSIRYSHRLLLWLLDEHVLGIRKYGDFDTTHSRGKVDPVFAARTILRTWWCITRQEHPGEASRWLFAWLENVLLSAECENNANGAPMQSPHRLACAALCRTLVFSSEDGGSPEDTLASRLSVPSEFIVRCSLSCCGLVEALPSYVVKDSWRRMEGARMHHSAATTPPSAKRDGSMRPLTPRTNDTLDETFVSAVSSLVDM